MIRCNILVEELKNPSFHNDTKGTYLLRLFVLLIRAVDPDPHGSAFIFHPGSGSAFNMRIRIPEGKFVY